MKGKNTVHCPKKLPSIFLQSKPLCQQLFLWDTAYNWNKMIQRDYWVAVIEVTRSSISIKIWQIIIKRASYRAIAVYCLLYEVNIRNGVCDQPNNIKSLYRRAIVALAVSSTIQQWRIIRKIIFHLCSLSYKCFYCKIAVSTSLARVSCIIKQEVQDSLEQRALCFWKIIYHPFFNQRLRFKHRSCAKYPTSTAITLIFTGVTPLWALQSNEVGRNSFTT